MNPFQQKVREIKESLFVASPVIVKEIYPEKQRADIKLKTKKVISGELKEPPMILDVPVSHKESKTFSERQLPEVGDVAWVVFSNRAIDKAMEDGQMNEPDYDRVLDINDCFLAGEWSTEQEGIPKDIGTMKPDDWLIGIHRSNQSRIYIRQGGNIVIHPGGINRVELMENANYSVPLAEMVWQVFNMHTHPTAAGPTGTPFPQLTNIQKSDHIKVDK